MTVNASVIEALRAEREGYVRRGLAARVAEVDAALAAAGATAVAAAVEAPDGLPAGVEMAVQPNPARVAKPVRRR